MINFGTVRPGTTLYVPFDTFDSNDPTASVTMTGLAVTDIEIYKDGSMTQRGSDAGYTLTDTDGIDIDGITGIHGFSIDLADNTTAGFYASGSQYRVVVSSITVDAGTINFTAATFQIGYPDAILNTTIATLASQTSFTLTAGPADNNALVGCVVIIHDVASAVQIETGVVSAYTGSTKTVTLAVDPGVFTVAATDNISFYLPITLANGAHGGAAASLNLGAGATISSADGHALTLTGGTNGHGLLASGAGTGSGLVGSGGSGGGHGLYAVGDDTGMGIYAVGGDAALALTAGMLLKSNASANPVGLYIEDGATITDDAGTALLISSTGGNGDGITIAGNGSGGDLVADITGNLSGSIGTVATDGISAASLATDASSEINTAVLAAISGIGTAGGAAINVDTATDNVLGGITGVTSETTFLGTQSVGTYANTSSVNAAYHTITGTAAGNTAMDIVYQFLTGSGTNPVQATWIGYVTGTNDTITISAWRHDTGAWESMATIVGTTGTTIQTKNITLFSRHRGTSVAELGKVYMRLHCAGMSTPVVATDQIVVSYAVTSRGSYSDGAVWLNTGASNTNTQSYVDGLPENPVSTIAAAITIADALKLKRIRVANGSTVTFAASMASRSLIGRNWTCALGGQAIDGAYIEGASVSGTGTCTTAIEFVDCHIGSGTTTGPAQFFRCGFSGTSGSKVTAGSAGEFLLIDCFSEVAGSGTPYFSFPGVCGVNIRRWSGGSNITLNNTSATLTMEVVTGGGQTIELGGADAEIRGICRSVTLTGITTDSTAQINCVTGPISLAGADGTVNIYGVCGAITDSRTGTPLGTNSAISLVNVNAQADTAITDGANSIADALLARNVSGGSSTGRTVKQALHAIRNKVAIADGTMTVYDVNDTDASWTAEVTGTSGADPITTVDPA